MKHTTLDHMYKIIIVMLLITGLMLGQDMIVRVYTPSRQDLKKISLGYKLDIAGARGGEWYDIVADRETLDKIIGSGLSYEVVVHSLTHQKEQVRANYLSYHEVNDSLMQMAQNYPSICKLDSLPIPTYQGNWLYGVKISDNPYIEEDDEPGFLIDGLHHANEWACIPVILFFADSILRAYNNVPRITEIINTTEIYCFPIINADGYLYDYPSAYSWRKNMEPFGDTIGTDPNRNYGGCSGDIEGDWGAIDEGAHVSHLPEFITFCGSHAYSADEVRALSLYVKSHTINAYMSYHSYVEYVLWSWGWTGQSPPDAAIINQVGNHMADMIQRLDGGSYWRGPCYSEIFPVTGWSVDWLYSWCHWVAGISNLSYTTEVGGGSFYPPAGDTIDHMCRENFKALEYLADFSDSIVLLCEGVVPPPEIYPLGNVNQDFTIYWHAKNTEDNHPNHWQLVELSNLSVIEDDVESVTGHWVYDGFTVSTNWAHSGTHSFFSGNSNNMNHAIRTAYPYVVGPGDSVTFWCLYNLEIDHDVAVVEVSENTKEWFNLDTTRFNGNSGGWVRKAYPLEDWVGISVYIRFRAMTDDDVLGDGFYVDDIYPVCLYGNIGVIASNITDTLHEFIGHPEGEYYYLARGFNAAWGWGDYSRLEKAIVSVGITESHTSKVGYMTPSLLVHPNPFHNRTEIRYMIQDTGSMIQEITLRIYDATGRLVKDFRLTPDSATQYGGLHNTLSWDGRDDQNRILPDGVYFLKFEAGDYSATKKLLLIR